MHQTSVGGSRAMLPVLSTGACSCGWGEAGMSRKPAALHRTSRRALLAVDNEDFIVEYKTSWIDDVDECF